MKRTLLLLIGILALFINCQSSTLQQGIVNHSLLVNLDINSSTISVRDTISFNTNDINNLDKLTFFLNKNLKIKTSNVSFTQDTNTDPNSIFKTYSIKKSDLKGDNKISITYEGIIDNNKEALLSAKGSMQGTNGIIFEKGIYLYGGTYWVPAFNDLVLSTFSMQVEVDKEWTILSQGNESKNSILGDKRIVTHKMNKPSNQVYLVGNKWTKYEKQSGDVSLEALLIKADQELADKYIKATEQYLKMYEDMLGKYPYDKFVLTENFWESGLGMPSFTLLGQKVIRMPWIIFSSYPHELLHNYWGNSVYSDMSDGNWTEGVTTYMADYFFKEMKNEGKEYRKNALQNFSNYVNEGNDFPVANFRSRQDKASSAIGYDKVVMINHMLRTKYGKEKYIEAYRKFYTDNKFTYASFKDIQTSFEKISGDDLSIFFKQWIHKTGAPQLKISDITSSKKTSRYLVSFKLSQQQKEEPFALDIPITITLDSDKGTIAKTVSLTKRNQEFTIEVDTKPTQIACDPDFNTMRRLAPEEIPATLSGLMGSKKVTIILPSTNNDLDKYKAFANAYKGMQMRSGNKVDVKLDSELDKIDATNYVWVLGKDNLHADKTTLPSEFLNIMQSGENVNVSQIQESGTIFYTFKDKGANKAYLDSNTPESLMQLLMKMRHYGSNSYLGFEGTGNTNTLKGVFPVFNSPMIYNL